MGHYSRFMGDDTVKTVNLVPARKVSAGDWSGLPGMAYGFFSGIMVLT